MSKLAELKQTIKSKASREARSSGSPHTDSDIDRELSQAGVARKPDDIPKQDTKSRKGKVDPGNVGTFFPSSTRTGKAYKIGPARRPQINHDKGHAELPKQPPELADYLSLLKWRSMMEGASALRPDLADAVAAYTHFLDGGGRDSRFSYERYIMNDISGRATLRSAILDAQYAAIDLWRNNGNPARFDFTGPPIPCGSNDPYLRQAFPYPATENWQKAIGAHFIWLSGSVNVLKAPASRKPEFSMKLVLHAEDQYNFNPGESDIKTGIPDSENGRFVVVELAHGYRNNAILNRSFSWKGFDLGVASMAFNVRVNKRVGTH